MSSYNIAETFLSINGEGPRAGQLAFFIRFAGCNLRCGYCDTKWARGPVVPFQAMSGEELYAMIKASGSENVTLTGGEPMIQPDILPLLDLLGRDPGLHTEVETNGSVDLSPCLSLPNRPAFTMDYKLPGSGMEHAMRLENLLLLERRDAVKFVCGSQRDLERAGEIMREYRLTERTGVFLSPVFGQLEPAEIVEFMKQNRVSGVRLQLQIHKFIWDPDQRGV